MRGCELCVTPSLKTYELINAGKKVSFRSRFPLFWEQEFLLPDFIHMFRRLSLVSAILAAVCFFASVPVRAQEHFGYCEDITNTSEALACVNRHKEDAQIRLNMVFVDLAKTMQDTPADREALQDSQNAWLSYRDDHCVFAAKRAGTPALERIYELSCITDLTEQRAELLAMSLYQGAREQPREFGTFPRWMNVLAHENPGTFWRYGKRLEMDFDCDGQAEEVLTGVAVSPARADAEATGIQADLVVAISSNPPTGRPQAHVLTFQLRGGGTGFCSPLVTLAPVAGLEREHCSPALKISDDVCFETVLRWTGTRFEEDAASKSGNDNPAEDSPGR